MAEVVHENVGADSDSGIGFFIGMLLVVAIVALLFFWGLPKLAGQAGNGQVLTSGQ